MHIVVLLRARAKEQNFQPHGFRFKRDVCRKSIKKVLLPSLDFKDRLDRQERNIINRGQVQTNKGQESFRLAGRMRPTKTQQRL